MKQFLTIFLLCIALLSASQNFTNGSVYNYSVGDTIVSTFQQFYGFSVPTPPPTYIYRVFKQKHFSPNQDTIYYVTYDTYSSLTNCFPCTQVTTSTLTSFYITNLNASAISYSFSNMDPCQKQVDTSYLGTCGHYEHLKYATKKPPPSNCFEPPIHSDKIIEGVGLFSSYKSLSFPSPGSGTETKLISFHKAGEPACGMVGSIPNGIRENNSDIIKLTIYPNPCAEQIQFDLKENGLYFIFDQYGSIVLKGEVVKGFSTIDTNGLSSGMYFLLVKTKNKSFASKFVKH